MVACPAGVYHYYKNVDPSKKDKQILTISEKEGKGGRQGENQDMLNQVAD